MRLKGSRLLRQFVTALILGAVLVPLAPDTGAVVAETQFSHRIETAHKIVSGLAR